MTLQEYLKKLPREKLDELQSVITRTNEDYDRLASNYQILYHGSPEDIAEFKLTRGKRGGFLGSAYEVNNLAVFFAETPELARAFGENRAGYVKQVKLYKVFIDKESILDMTKWSNVPTSLKRTAKRLVKDNLSRYHMWVLLDDPEFVRGILDMGYTAARFSETRKTLKDLEVSGDPKSVAVFDASKIRLYRKPFETLSDVEAYLKQIGEL